MGDVEGLQTLISWFGDRPFTVKDLNEERQWELARQVGAAKPTLHGTRTELGKWLTAMNGYSYRQCRLVVLEWATGKKAGTYQIQGLVT